MAFNPLPKVAAARDFARKFKKQMVIILAISDSTLEMASYGENPTLCDKAKRIGNHAFETILRGFGEKGKI